jgi:hypothetical protein
VKAAEWAVLPANGPYAVSRERSGDTAKPKIASDRPGQSSVVIALDTCSHLLPNLQETAALKLEEGLHEAARAQEDHPAPGL